MSGAIRPGISTSTNLHQGIPGNPFHFSPADCARALAQAGFTHADFTFQAYCAKEGPLAAPNWKAWVYEVGNAFAKAGLPIHQTHTLFYLHRGDRETLAFHAELVDRCLEASAMLGASWTVMHILRVVDLDTRDPKTAMEKNRTYFTPYGEKARRLGIGIAIENGLTGFYHTAAELLELLSLLGDDAFGICWDTGHANIVLGDQTEDIRRLGPRLRALHLNDNHGGKDEHLLPYFGTVDFHAVMRAIRDAGFDGILTLECPGSTRSLPPPLRPAALQLAAQMGDALRAEL